MADQTVRISNLPDSGSPARVAYDLWYILRGKLEAKASKSEDIAAQLDLYAECLDATHGSRPYRKSK
jgi:hypothetical protein